MNKLFLACLILFCIHATAQKKGKGEDSLLLKELQMTTYDKDTSAEAVVLSDIGEVYILTNNDHGFSRYFTRIIKIKILSQAGLSYGSMPIPYYYNEGNGEKITNLEGITYNLEYGKIISTSLSKEQVYEENSGPISIKRVAVPDVKVGSIVTISYTLRSSNVEYFNWDFQNRIPVICSQFTFFMPSFCSYVFLQQNIDTNSAFSHSIQSSDDFSHNYNGLTYQNVVCKFSYRNVPAFKDESYVSNEEDYLAHIRFQLSKWSPRFYWGQQRFTFLSSWKEFTNRLLEISSFGGYLNSNEGDLNKVFLELKLDGKPETEKIKTIVNYVKTNYKWNNSYSLFATKKMNDFIAQKSGNSADINLFLTALFRASKIDAKPVIISTRRHGKVLTSYPFYDFYNDIICYVKTDSLSMLLDATELLLPYYTVPPECINGFGYVVQKSDSNWVNITSRVSSGIFESLLIQIPPSSDSIDCRFSIKANGYKGFLLRKDWNEGYEKFSPLMIKNKGMDILDSFKVFSLDNPEEPFSISYSAALPLVTQKIDSAHGYRIIFPPFLKETVQENPFKTSDRKYPIDMNYQQGFKYQSFVMIPEGYKISQMPAEISYSLPNNRATFSYKIKKISVNAIEFTSDLSFNTSVYQPSEYKDLKTLYDMAIKKYKEPIILEKE